MDKTFSGCLPLAEIFCSMVVWVLARRVTCVVPDTEDSHQARSRSVIATSSGSCLFKDHDSRSMPLTDL
eukprot:scaffold19193_cov133-Skeletonema_dohrnii-CCMP3373.AAC.2